MTSFVEQYDQLFFDISGLSWSIYCGAISPRVLCARLIAPFVARSGTTALDDLRRALQWEQHFQERFGDLETLLCKCGMHVSEKASTSTSSLEVVKVRFVQFGSDEDAKTSC